MTEGWKKSGGKIIESVDERAAGKEIAEAKRLYNVDKYDEAYRLFYKNRFDPEFDADAMNNLGDLYYHELGVSQDLNLAKYWFEKSAELGDPEAIWWMGIIYDLGLGVSRDTVLVKYWWEESAELGSEISKEMLKK